MVQKTKIYIYIYIYIYIPHGQKYKTTLRNEKKILFTIVKV